MRCLGKFVGMLFIASLAACSNGRGSLEGGENQTNTSGFTVGGAVTGIEGSGLVLQVNSGGDLSVSANGAFAFASPIANGTAYEVTIRSQPVSPAQTCAVSSGVGRIAGTNITNVAVVCTPGSSSFTVGGSVGGLTGSGLILRNNSVEDLPIASDSEFIFPTTIATGAAYSVTVAAQPTNPAQTCTVEDGSGVMSTADVTSVRVICSTSAFTIGGTVSGLTSLGLKLRNNAEVLTIGADGQFTFLSTIASGASYAVSVEAQPQNQNCVVQNGSGTVQDMTISDVAVTCATNVYTIGGSITGLAPSARVVLRMRVAGETVNNTATRNGVFAFERSLANGIGYVVDVETQPDSPAQDCTVANAAGIISGANVTGVAVTCITRRFTISGEVSGLQGSGLILQLNGANDLPIASNGSFTFDGPLDSGARYDVTVASNPSNFAQTCTVQQGTGTVGSGNVRGVRVTCALNRYSIGGTVSGLLGDVLVLQNNGDDPVEIATGGGAFTFAAQIASGGAYNVTVRTSPSNPTQACTISNGAGTVGAAAVTNIAVSCATSSFTIGGTVTGLAGSGLVLRNNGGDDRSISANGTFTFATTVPSGAGYSVSVATPPTTPLQNCTVTSGSGVVGGGNVTGVQINCTTIGFLVGGSVSGLAGTGLILQDNGVNDLPIAADGAFAFSNSLAPSEPYNVTVSRQPLTPSQTCAVSNGSGAIGNADVTSVAVACTTNSFTVSGTVSGLLGFGLILRVNDAPDLRALNGGFSFPTPVLSGTIYSVIVARQPNPLPFLPPQICVVTNGNGTMGAAGVTDVTVSCR